VLIVMFIKSLIGSVDMRWREINTSAEAAFAQVVGNVASVTSNY